uniref:Uncharacterized protein n=1 Tax=Neobodo designis TaxID=312471 RepID=A0A7S1W6B7_NEODS|mmetsp:Transcript_54049/g.166283  ORF Transcript_54049/g.166283 Transcript_54049/m.166283 type:complete len:224 (+) Transcript_54049:52-723(+)|eukprot:CAMPEP_0174831810 /NCGR_PEP_ID=MMETSP1114-20130205/3320_1 /TAXON_ID=312471 /ORGANISM="Neobodo designis, Strain CCAP 1951/1" /LENGTH=223 /DNA_ID=CAMNT_0016065655 /DNA_START=51 /DNA_END=722 /DNA_ORIENTATION=+
MAELLTAITSALKASQPGLPEQQVIMGAAMRVFGGDWTPFDQCREQLKEHIVKECDGEATPEAMKALADKWADSALAALSEDANLAMLFASEVKDDLPPEQPGVLGLLQAALKKHLPITLNVIANHGADSATQPFSAALKAAETELVGELFEGVTAICTNGQAGLSAILRGLSGQGSQIVMAKYPQHAQAAMFGIPMAINMMNQMHAQYRTDKGLAPAGAPAA